MGLLYMGDVESPPQLQLGSHTVVVPRVIGNQVRGACHTNGCGFVDVASFAPCHRFQYRHARVGPEPDTVAGTYCGCVHDSTYCLSPCGMSSYDEDLSAIAVQPWKFYHPRCDKARAYPNLPSNEC